VRDLKEEQLAESALPNLIPTVSGETITWGGYLDLRRKAKFIANESSPVAKSYDRHWLEQCEKRSLLSYDQGTKIGCVIVGSENEERSGGSDQHPLPGRKVRSPMAAFQC